MKDSITKDDLYALILMLKAGHDGAIVVLESENDCRGLDSFIDSTNCQTIPGHGKENVVGVATLVSANGLQHVLCIADRDFDHLRDNLKLIAGLVYTDEYDLDATFFFVPGVPERVAGQVVTNYATLLATIQACSCASVRELCIGQAATIGAVRLASIEDDLELRLEGFPQSLAYGDSGGAPNYRAVIELALQRSKPDAGNGLDADAIEALARKHAARTSKEERCCGHDLAGGLVAAVDASGKVNGGWGRKQIESMVRAAVSFDAFKGTDLYRRVANWASAEGCIVWA